MPFEELVTAMGLGGDRKLGWVRRVAPGDEHRVFNLPIERLAAQVSAAADLALTSPREDYDTFIVSLTGPSRVLDDRGGPNDPSSAASEGPDPADSRMPELAQRVRTGIDQLQISLGERWRHYVQGAALWISGVYGIVLVHSSHGVAFIESAGSRNLVPDSLVDRGAEARYVLAALVIGGPTAWIARDLCALIERSRR